MTIQPLIPQLIGWGIQWISQQRDLHRPFGRELAQAEKGAFDLFFDRTTLDSVRLKWVQLLQNPPFYLQIQQMGLPLIPFADMDGITFADTILLAQKGVRHEPPPPLPLLFHEMVHVVQYEVLGIETFVTRYVHGWSSRSPVCFRMDVAA